MSTLLIDKINTSLEQNITLTSTDRVHIAAIIPYLYMHNAPAGTFTLELIKSAVTIFNDTFTCAQIKSSMNVTDNYAHVFYPIVPSTLLNLESGLYKIKITTSGYTPTEDSYLGWVKQYDNIQNELDYTIVNDTYAPYAIRFKGFS